ncbi:YjjG family noncanonical pyrimidine nucleotidase [Exiguobacterium sp. s161]|uniref:YjjG family noncanonical pyrimidine nucleotidase n=1 Tax=Exiguobacterium sp. s161 TaxID=2751191 RepID=UPI001BE84F4F|nr:YjjG family noncanonical pyrimidine nucleotidase [Exiguobacterium sp. s161]
MFYTTVLFDIDHTLLDFEATERTAFRRLLEQQELQWTPEREARYKTLNQALWKALERGEVTREEVIHSRFVTFFAEEGRTVDGREVDETYRGYLAQGTELIPGATELLEQLAGNVTMYVVTNGISKTQRARLEGAELTDFFEGIFVSEETGFQKPMAGFFNHVFARIPQFDPARTIIVGDSLSADIAGGNQAGIATCWFNPEGKSATDITPTFMITSLVELPALLENAAVLQQ